MFFRLFIIEWEKQHLPLRLRNDHTQRTNLLISNGKTGTLDIQVRTTYAFSTH